MQADQAAGTKTWVMQSGGAGVLKLTTADDTKCVSADGSLHFNAPKYEVEFWLMRGAQSVDDAASKVAPQIVSEFKEFKPDSTTDLTIAGSPAKRLVGTGQEADDGDAGSADLIVFKVGDQIFVACTHGEKLITPAREGMLTMVQTAQKP